MITVMHSRLIFVLALFWKHHNNIILIYNNNKKGIAEGFENPIYKNLPESSLSDQKRANRLILFDNQAIMDIYESILDFNTNKQLNGSEKPTAGFRLTSHW